ncbi:hypothetical protein H8B06_13915 [Sphingobacterium sp. DN00404]|uniref:Uncharacterized protein n=1 Tax=Sphingobacterium micropteri TaxID=2763501 RepID=A0ABR7YRJ0_9SPHI|nr:hypothetical protein [Sphingobacterium micropteri]MBD1433930.1 hypothetical protein [Sphingobacterium micropteri]
MNTAMWVLLCFLISTFVHACQSPRINQTTYDVTLDTGSLYFAPTMQQELPMGKNAVYAVSFPLAWQVVRKELNISGQVNTESADLHKLDGSKSIKKALDEDDYERKIVREGRMLSVTTKQEVNLHFVPAFVDFPNGITFDGKTVNAFGTSGFQNAEYMNRLHIAAYRDDDHFILQLLPKEQDHELFLFKTDTVYSTFEQMYADLLAACRHERGQHQLTDLDVVYIPKIEFDERHQFHQFLKKIFFVKKKDYSITGAQQQITFGLNQHGVSMKTEAEIIINDGAYPMDDPPVPKQLVFDKPFYILMRKTDMENPYMALYVTNADILEKEKTRK